MTTLEKFDKQYKFIYRNEVHGYEYEGDTFISEAIAGIDFYMVDNSNNTISLYDGQDDDEPVFTGTIDEMADYINSMSEDYHTFDDEVRWIEAR